MKCEIEIEGVPEGYEPVRFGIPTDGEGYIQADGKLAVASGIWDQPRLIVRKKTTARPWTFETAPTAVKVRSKQTGKQDLLCLVDDGFVTLKGNRSCFSFAYVLHVFEQLDGSPCGEVVQ